MDEPLPLQRQLPVIKRASRGEAGHLTQFGNDAGYFLAPVASAMAEVLQIKMESPLFLSVALQQDVDHLTPLIHLQSPGRERLICALFGANLVASIKMAARETKIELRPARQETAFDLRIGLPLDCLPRARRYSFGRRPVDVAPRTQIENGLDQRQFLLLRRVLRLFQHVRKFPAYPHRFAFGRLRIEYRERLVRKLIEKPGQSFFFSGSPRQ